jgi:2-polyprenyl-3-methyl-5-hydroxy-6-metoxy-1,4-benzoquinol methylase
MRQDAEWCVVRDNGHWRQIRFHDYHELYAIPGLYERIFYEILRCDSPQVVCSLLQHELAEAGVAADELRVLDLGAGNGMVGEQLAEHGAEFIVGTDIIEEAGLAAERDRPGVYDDYHVVDMTDLDARTRKELADCRFNTLTCVAALGFGDIPTAAFTAAYNLIRPGGWIAFNIKEKFLNGRDSSGFAELIRSITDAGALQIRRKKRYCHRLGTDRQPLHYVGVVGRKLHDIS